jgi:hypothetical protein
VKQLALEVKSPFKLKSFEYYLEAKFIFLIFIKNHHLGAGSMNQVVDHPSSKCETLSSNPSTTKNKSCFI